MSRLGDTRTFREIIEYNGIKLGTIEQLPEEMLDELIQSCCEDYDYYQCIKHNHDKAYKERFKKDFKMFLDFLEFKKLSREFQIFVESRMFVSDEDLTTSKNRIL